MREIGGYMNGVCRTILRSPRRRWSRFGRSWWLKRVGLLPQFQVLKTVTGIGPILALTIALEVGDIKRFPGVERVRFLLPLCGQPAAE
jgi:hypothetical protein